MCGRLAEKALPRGIDGLFVRGRAYEMVCDECFRRIGRLYRRFRPSFGGCVSVTVVYDPESRVFTISAFNEYGDSAYLSEDMRETRSLVRSIWTGETVILEGDRVVGEDREVLGGLDSARAEHAWRLMECQARSADQGWAEEKARQSRDET